MLDQGSKPDIPCEVNVKDYLIILGALIRVSSMQFRKNIEALTHLVT